MTKTQYVHIGEVKIAKHGERLKAILGSCVGIAFLWPEKKICGLAHCLLPHSPAPTHLIGARFVDQAVLSLKSLMKIAPIDAKKVTAVVVGGGNMTSPKNSKESSLVGAANFRSAMHEVENLNIRVVHSDSGGNHGRTVTIDSNEFKFEVDLIPRITNRN